LHKRHSFLATGRKKLANPFHMPVNPPVSRWLACCSLEAGQVRDLQNPPLDERRPGFLLALKLAVLLW